MTDQTNVVTRTVAWLLRTRATTTPAIQAQLESGLFTSLPIFFGGVVNTTTIAAIGAWRSPAIQFQVWLALEIMLAVLRFIVIARGRRAIRNDEKPPVTIAATMACAWAGSVGFGAFIAVASEDWTLSTIVCLSAAGMVCGICLRNFGTPRLAALMVFLALFPCAIASAITSEPVLAIVSLQLPLFMIAISSSASSMHRLFVSRMIALRDLEESELLNRCMLDSSPDFTLILNDRHEIVSCNRPAESSDIVGPLIGENWVTLLPQDKRNEAEKVLALTSIGLPGNLTTSHVTTTGALKWYDVIASPILDGSGRSMIVARDITHQKSSEARAIWMANHDPLTRLGNRTLLQDELDRRLSESIAGRGSALLIVDVDHFKTINDTLGHDAGDALLCRFAEKLLNAAGESALVTRTGGDEFALVIAAQTLADIECVGSKIYAGLTEPFVYRGRAIECSASIGASVLLKDGETRSEVLKAADVALYAAKSNGRGQMKIFDHSMKVDGDKRHAMIAAGRDALRHDHVVPYYQPKMRLGTSEIVGLEALLRWSDNYDLLRSPGDLRAAFEDPRLAAELTNRMVEKVLDQMQAWSRVGVGYGHVAINVTANDLGRGDFASELLDQLAHRNINPAMLQLEVTETAFFGRTAEPVEAALRILAAKGIRIALDDFGTGYSSLSHLKQFPVHLLKLDRSFVAELDQQGSAQAIAAAVISLGHCLGMEVVAEGVENRAQETRLIALGCDAAQGFLYSQPLPAASVPFVLCNGPGALMQRSA